MLPLISGADVTKKNIFIYSLLMIPAVASTYYFNLSGLFISSLNLILTLYYVFLCFLLLKSQSLVKSNILAKKVFVYSIFYLFLIFLLILIDRFTGIFIMDKRKKNLITALALIIFMIFLFLMTFYNIGIYNREI